MPQTRAVPLGSRKNLCINDDLRASLTHHKELSRGKKHQPAGPGGEPIKDSVRGGDLDEACRELNNSAFASWHSCWNVALIDATKIVIFFFCEMTTPWCLHPLADSLTMCGTCTIRFFLMLQGQRNPDARSFPAWTKRADCWTFEITPWCAYSILPSSAIYLSFLRSWHLLVTQQHVLLAKRIDHGPSIGESAGYRGPRLTRS